MDLYKNSCMCTRTKWFNKSVCEYIVIHPSIYSFIHSFWTQNGCPHLIPLSCIIKKQKYRAQSKLSIYIYTKPCAEIMFRIKIPIMASGNSLKVVFWIWRLKTWYTYKVWYLLFIGQLAEAYWPSESKGQIYYWLAIHICFFVERWF